MKARASGLFCFGVCAALAAAHVYAASPVIVDATGRVMAFYVGPVETSRVRGVTTEGFLLEFYMTEGALSAVPADAAGAGAYGVTTGTMYFTEPNCGGTAFGQLSNGSVPYRGGIVFEVEFQQQRWYVPKYPTIQNFTAASERQNANFTCSASNVTGLFVPIFPNDPAITGFSNLPFTPPLRIEVATISDPSGLLLRDGFETPT